MLNAKDLDKNANRYWKVLSAPSVEPITLTEVKAWGRIDGDDEDSLITDIITASRQKAENYLGRALIERTIELFLDFWPSQELLLPLPPLMSVTKIETLTEDGVASSYASTNYFVVTEAIPGKIVIKKGVTAPTNENRDTGGIKVTYKAGYGSSASNVDTVIRTSLLEWAVLQYENRKFDEELPDEVKKNLRFLRVVRR